MVSAPWLLAFLASVVSATSFLSDVVTKAPQCSIPCLIDASSDSGCARSLANKQLLANCICKNMTLLSVASTCVQKKCSWDDTLVAVNVTLGELCISYPKESRGYLLRIMAIVALGLTIPVVSLRILSRLYSSGRLWWDDYTSILATTTLIAMLALQFKSVELGFGRHVWDVDTFVANDLYKYYWAGQQLYITVQVFAKISILILYMRLFQTVWFQAAVKGSIVFMALHGLIFLFCCIFQCLPIEAAWDKSLPGRCLDFRIVAYTGAALSVFEDIVLVLLPIPELCTMKLNWRKGVGLAFMFGFGLLATVTSIVRIKFLLGLWDTYDQTWDNVDPILWSVMEQFSAIICGSLPSCRAIVSAMVSRFWPRLGRSSEGYVGGSLDLPEHPPQEKRPRLFFNGRREADLADHHFRVAQGRTAEPHGLDGARRPGARRAPRDPYAGLYDLDEEPAGGEHHDGTCVLDNCPCELSPALCRSATRRTSLGAQADDPQMVSFQIRSPHDVVRLAKRGSSAIRPSSSVLMLASDRHSLAGDSTVCHTVEYFDDKPVGLLYGGGIARPPVATARKAAAADAQRVSRVSGRHDPDMVSYQIWSPEEVVEHSKARPALRPYSLSPSLLLGSTCSIGRAVSCDGKAALGVGGLGVGSDSGSALSLAPPDDGLTRIYTSSGDGDTPGGRRPAAPIPGEASPPATSTDGSDGAQWPLQGPRAGELAAHMSTGSTAVGSEHPSLAVSRTRSRQRNRLRKPRPGAKKQ